MNKLLITLAAFCLVIWGFIAYVSHLATPRSEATYFPRQPHIQTKTYSLLPGQTMTVENHDYRKVELQSQFPVQFVVGSCFANYTVMWNCNSDPTSVYVKDSRSMPIFTAPRANAITLTFTEF